MFGDNLSFISDTTIAATKTMGVAMKDKFITNLKIVLPAAAVTVVTLTAVSLNAQVTQAESYSFNYILALPYFLVFILALMGLNVFIVLLIGILMFLISGLCFNTLTFASALESLGTGTSAMFETMIVTILVASISSLIKVHGGFETILQFIKTHFNSKRGGMFGIALLTSFMDVATANNTVAIVTSSPIVREISTEFGISKKISASLMDICSCIMQGIIPYGAQLLVAAGIMGISSKDIVPELYYQYILAFFVAVMILRAKNESRI